MSIWTHVAGVIRYDDLRGLGAGLRHRYMTAVGGTGVIPTGSEGALTTSFVENPQPNSVAAYTVTIWGDLRDYDDLDAIEAYFRGCIEDDGFMVRNAVMIAEVGGGETRIWRSLDQDTGKTVLVNVAL